MTFDKASIFRSAWKFARIVAKVRKVTVLSVFGQALRTAWAMAKEELSTTSPAAPAAPQALSTATKVECLANVVIHWRQDLRKSFAFRFICDNADRLGRYGDKAVFSVKQAAIVDDLYNRYA